MPKYLVEAVSIFRLRYVVDANEATHASDEVVMNHDGHLEEFSQKHLDETITSVREIDDAEYLRLFNEDNEYLNDWIEQDKFKFVNKVNYTEEETT